MKPANLSGKHIKSARDAKNMGQVELAAALEVEFDLKLTQSDISEIERQARGVKDFELDAIARVLQVSPLWLLRGDE